MAIRPSIDRACLEFIGEIVVNFNLVEFLLELGIGWILGVDDPNRARIITTGNSFRRNVEIMSGLYKKVFPDRDYTVAEEMLNRLFVVEGDRNKFVHSMWTTGQRHKATARVHKGLKFQTENISPDELKKIASDIAQVADDLLSFMVGFYPSEELPMEPSETGFKSD